MAISLFRNKTPELVRHLILILTDNSDTAFSMFKNVVEDFEKLPINKKNELFRKIMNESKNPNLVAFANELIRNSPRTAEVAVGFAPLNPCSKMIGKAVEHMVYVRRRRRKTVGRGLDSFM